MVTFSVRSFFPHRTPRFTPFYVNSGFYFQKYNERTQFLMEKMLKSISEIAVTHSHQATLTRHLTEAHHLVGLQINVLAQEDYPSGIMFHHNKKYIERMKAHEVEPVVFHMCWTTSREEKVSIIMQGMVGASEWRLTVPTQSAGVGYLFQRDRHVVPAGLGELLRERRGHAQVAAGRRQFALQGRFTQSLLQGGHLLGSQQGPGIIFGIVLMYIINLVYTRMMRLKGNFNAAGWA